MEIPFILEQSPRLAAFAEAVFGEAHRLARSEAARQTRLALRQLPPESPFAMDDALDPDFWPGGPG